MAQSIEQKALNRHFNRWKPGMKDDVKKTLWPLVPKTLFKEILQAQGNDTSWNPEVYHSIKGQTFLVNAIAHLKSARRKVEKMNSEYDDRLKQVIGLMEEAKKQWPLIVE